MAKELTAYKALLDKIVSEIEQHRIKAARGLNATQTQLYFSPGATIPGKQEQEGWGKSVVAQLAADLSRLTKSSRGFSAKNLWYMRQYFIEYKDNGTLKNLSFQVPWGQNILILSKLKNEQQRNFYLSKTVEAGWSRNTMLNQIKAEAHTRQAVLQKQHNFKDTFHPSHRAGN